MGTKKFFLSLTEYVICLILYMYFTTAIHEWIHLTLLNFFGGTGYIIQTWFGAGVVFTSPPSNPIIVALAGGLGVTLLYGILAYWNWQSKDIEEFAALLPLIFSQSAYALFEVAFIFSMPLQQYINLASIVMAIGFIIGFLISLLHLSDTLLNKLNTNSNS